MSGIWDLYEERAEVRGASKRDTALKREKRYITSNLPDNLSYHRVSIDGYEQDVAIVSSDNLDEKTILSMPGDDIRHGGLVRWMESYWLITDKDADTTVYTKGKLRRCNYLLKWVDSRDVIHEQWCIIEDGTKLLSSFRAVRAA